MTGNENKPFITNLTSQVPDPRQSPRSNCVRNFIFLVLLQKWPVCPGKPVGSCSTQDDCVPWSDVPRSDVPRRKCSAATLYRQLQPNETKHIAYAQTLQRFVFVQTQAYIFHFWSIKLLNFYLELVILKTVTPSVSPCCVIVSAALPFSYDKSVRVCPHRTLSETPWKHGIKCDYILTRL